MNAPEHAPRHAARGLDRQFWRDLGTLAALALGGIALAVGLWAFILVAWAVS